MEERGVKGISSVDKLRDGEVDRQVYMYICTYTNTYRKMDGHM